MAGFRFWLQCSLAVLLGLTTVQIGHAQIDVPPVFFQGPLAHSYFTFQTADSTCKVYSLADLGDDPNLCKWIAETIPQMIQPASWKCADGKSKLSYYAPGRVMVINQTPAVQAQVDEFLQSLKKSLLLAKTAKRDPQVMLAQFQVPDNTRPVGPTPPYQSGYPVPYPPAAPKHLFHFIIRYEGAGIIDSNVVKFAKALNNQTQPSQCPSVPMVRIEAAPSGGVTSVSGTNPPTTLPQPQYSPPSTTPGSEQSAPATGNVRPMPPADPVPSAPSAPGLQNSPPFSSSPPFSY